MTAISQSEIAPLLQFGGCSPNLSVSLDRRAAIVICASLVPKM